MSGGLACAFVEGDWSPFGVYGGSTNEREASNCVFFLEAIDRRVREPKVSPPSEKAKKTFEKRMRELKRLEWQNSPYFRNEATKYTWRCSDVVGALEALCALVCHLMKLTRISLDGVFYCSHDRLDTQPIFVRVGLILRKV